MRVIHEEDVKHCYSIGGYYELIEYLNQRAVDGKISTEEIHKFIEEYRNDPTGSKVFKDFLAKVQAEEVINMFTLEYDAEEEKQALAEQWREEGREAEREEGVRNLVLVLKSRNDSAEIIISDLMSVFNLTETEARAKVEKYSQ